MRRLVLVLCLMALGCGPSVLSELTPRERLRNDALGTPLQGVLSDGSIRYCVKEDHASDGLTQVDLRLQLTSALLVRKCGEQVYVQSHEIYKHSSSTQTGTVSGLLPRYEKIGEWMCASAAPHQVQVRCSQPPSDEPVILIPKGKAEPPPPTNPSSRYTPRKLATISPSEQPSDEPPHASASSTRMQQIITECSEQERGLLRDHLAERDRLTQIYDDRVEEAIRTKAGMTLRWVLNQAQVDRDWDLNEADVNYKWKLHELQINCRWKLETGDE